MYFLANFATPIDTHMDTTFWRVLKDNAVEDVKIGDRVNNRIFLF